ncbi:MAG: Phospholipase D/competence protein ComEA helix-hairpin-helix domain protein [Candidatus Giovannonibacteria bacterium GW2011_GWB1_45_9b]|uniref:Phospholipase D/competence protein ComEA helix-hairpin-helix domain protein n=1 Tax=Candidatus Giovannonibacteria bacterium GW2011_GWB1_45_9b TaxID=1618653 RepID=A0A0G1N7W9_9BACT|nr:MAG: Phospholipase D/competence protein ComEA helix-hairpin-helix domain protein [Candidatus Peregrinibacteria bacterium GW2011_GWC2_39_14]KKU16639.1 MAG: Phospholipase D/competence protein ComEA helix-hairpin-helix domain protein [Candidatus Giovannonibacteria bacterium GW2011_GWB1_45_9b]
MAILIIFLGLFALPFFAEASVIINEIAWMGTSNSAQDEWIELYSASGANLEGWILKTADDAMNISLSGTIPAGGYFLIERTDDSTVPNVSADLVTPFGSGLSNSGEVLILINASGSEENRVDASGGWPAGNNVTKDTMQKSGNDWITAPGTPKAQNPGGAVTPPPSVSPSPPLSSSGSSSTFDEKKISAEIIAHETGIAGAEILFEGKAFGFDGKEIIAQRYIWSFGDGDFANGRKVSHTFKFPGIYQISLNVLSGEFSASAYDSLEIMPSELSISEAGPEKDSWIEIKNRGPKRVEIAGWIVEAFGKNFAFPSGTFMAANSFLVLTEEISGINLLDAGEILLKYPSGQEADSFLYSGNLSNGQSFTRIGEDVKITIATPGKEEGKIAQRVLIPTPFTKTTETISQKNPAEDISVEAETKIVPETQTAQVSSSFFSKNGIYWGLSALGLGLIAALGFLASKRI